jgi:hypothetical protein
VIEKLRQLEKKATPGRWGYYYEHKDNVANRENGFVVTLYHGDEMYYLQPTNIINPDFTDYHLAAMARNALPKFLALYDAVKRDHWHDEYSENCKCFRCNPNFEDTKSALDDLG